MTDTPSLPGFEHLLIAAPAAAEARTTRRGPSPEELLEGLNDPQREAVIHAGPPLLVVAGAGSGKTRVLTRRIAWLIQERNAHPGSILAITFTNKAAAEMKERVADLVGGRAKIMWVSTFHSACVRILRKEAEHLGYERVKSNFSIYDAQDQKRLIAMVCGDLNLDPRRFQPGPVLHQISSYKNELRDPAEVKADAKNSFEETYAAAYELYQRRLREANALDFDDLIMETVRLFQTKPGIRETYRRRFRHLLVDEYQDTNHAQYSLIHQLCGQDFDDVSAGSTTAGVDVVPPAELMVVGDADQSIYAFRGADIRNIMDFENDFPDARTILLEQNYRSTQTILTAANAVIDRNEGRRAKRLWSDAGDGEKIIGYVADTEHDEARFVSSEIDKLTDQGMRAGDVAVFYRTNAQSRVFEEIFMRTGMPYKVVGGVRFYERREIRDALAYLRALVNPDDQVSMRRILNTPKRGIGDRAVLAITLLADRDRLTFWEALQRADQAPGLATRSQKSIEQFVAVMNELMQMVEAAERPDVILESALDRSGYLKSLEESDDPQDESRIENLAELVAVAREFAEDPIAAPSADPADVDAGLVEPGLADFLERVALVADSDQIPDAPDDDPDAPPDTGMVTLMTLHTAKGLEFPAVFLTGMEDGVFPHSRALGDRSELEEERRLAYVGITRARQRLHVSRAVVRSAWGAPAHNPASRFLSELPVDLVDWKRTEAEQAQWARPTYASQDRGGYDGQRLGAPTAAGRRNFSSAAARADAAAKSKPARAIPNLEPGDRVTHDSFGLGTVVSVEGVAEKSVASIDFGSDGVKRLLLRYAPVEKL
ncbi:DNA helicase PcrA [Nocardioides montaniterrae]